MFPPLGAVVWAFHLGGVGPSLFVLGSVSLLEVGFGLALGFCLSIRCCRAPFEHEIHVFAVATRSVRNQSTDCRSDVSIN